MRVAFITPTPMLQQFATKSDYHLVLAHIYKEDAAYREFYKERVAAGDFVILDNSAYELQEAVNVQIILECAKDLNPTAVFLPDSRFDKDRTIALAREAKEVLSGHGWKLLGVPQGNDLRSILECYRWMGSQDWIDGFGLYEEIGEVAGLGIRKDFLAYLEEYRLVYPGKHYHMLGMEEDLTQIQALGSYRWVNGIDSAKAIVYSLNGILLLHDGTDVPYPHRPKDFFSRECPKDLIRMTEHNIAQVKLWANA